MKKMILVRVLVVILLICPTRSAISQVYVGVKGGISIPNLQSGSTDNPLSSGWSSRKGPYFGIVGNYMLAKSLGLQVELNYSSQGGKKNGQQAIPTKQFINPVPPGFPKYVYADYNNEAKLNYLELPVMLKVGFPFAKIFSFFIQGGPYAGYLLNAKNITDGSSIVYLEKAETTPLTPGPVSFDSTLDIKDQLNKFNFGIQAGIGFSMKLPGGMLLLTGGGNYGFTPIQKDEENGKDRTGAATITIGYVFKL